MYFHFVFDPSSDIRVFYFIRLNSVNIANVLYICGKIKRYELFNQSFKTASRRLLYAKKSD